MAATGVKEVPSSHDLLISMDRRVAVVDASGCAGKPQPRPRSPSTCGRDFLRLGLIHLGFTPARAIGNFVKTVSPNTYFAVIVDIYLVANCIWNIPDVWRRNIDLLPKRQRILGARICRDLTGARASAIILSRVCWIR